MSSVNQRRDFTLSQNRTSAIGRLDGETVIVSNASYVTINDEFRQKYYGGKGSNYNDSVALFVEYQTEGADSVWKVYTIGSAEAWTVIDDGDYFESPLGKQLYTRCNYARFIDALVAAGYPSDRLVQGAKAMVGMVLTLTEVPTGTKRTGSDGKEYENTLTLPAKVVSLPGDKDKQQVEADKTTNDAKQILLSLLAIVGSIPKKTLYASLVQNKETLGIDDPTAARLFTKVYTDTNLKKWNEIKYENGVLSL